MANQGLSVSGKQRVEPEAGEFTYEGDYFSPAVDIFDTEKELVLLADMPGVSAEHVEVDLRNDTLTIIGKVPVEPQKGEILLAEYQTGNYFRTFRLTEIVDRTKISASMADGVLKLVLPKVEKAIPRKIPITAG